ncbi:MAG: DUF1543 domain-containing protein [Bdellovibrionota bacterium]
MKLFMIHCGYYDLSVCGGQFEFHVNYFVAAPDAEAAKFSAKQNAEFKEKKMHIDGLQEIEAIDGYRLHLEKEIDLQGKSLVHGLRFRELAPRPSVTS